MSLISVKLVLISQCPDRRKWHFQGSSFQNFPGEDPPTTLAPAALGVWDFASGNAPKEITDNLISRYKRGKYVEGIVRQTVKDYMQSNNSLPEATNLKYRNFLSCRKYNVLCKTQSSVLKNSVFCKDVWVPRNVKCLGIDIQLLLSHVSNESIENFVKTLDMQ